MKRIFNTLKEKWPEYILEILVLIIGIYGAFALDNWNNEREERRKEINYLNQINKEFKKNKEQFNYVLTSNKKSLESCYAFLQEFDKDKPNPDSVLHHWNSLINTWIFNPSQSSIESLVNSSSLDIIQNEQLKLLLLSWSDLILDYNEEEQLAIDHAIHDIIVYYENTLDIKAWESGVINPPLDKGLRNRILIRIYYLNNIFNNDQNELNKVRETIDLIIELTEKT